MRKDPLARKLHRARKTLALPEKASLRDLQKAYHRLCRRYHPDANRTEPHPEQESKMVEINAAYALLKDYMERCPISLEVSSLEEEIFDPEAWWRSRFGDSFRSGS